MAFAIHRGRNIRATSSRRLWIGDSLSLGLLANAARRRVRVFVVILAAGLAQRVISTCSVATVVRRFLELSSRRRIRRHLLLWRLVEDLVLVFLFVGIGIGCVCFLVLIRGYKVRSRVHAKKTTSKISTIRILIIKLTTNRIYCWGAILEAAGHHITAVKISVWQVQHRTTRPCLL